MIGKKFNYLYRIYWVVLEIIFICSDFFRVCSFNKWIFLIWFNYCKFIGFGYIFYINIKLKLKFF